MWFLFYFPDKGVSKIIYFAIKIGPEIHRKGKKRDLPEGEMERIENRTIELKKSSEWKIISIGKKQTEGAQSTV